MSDAQHGDAGPGTLRVTFTEPAEAEVDSAYAWLLSFGLHVAEKWLTGLTELLDNEADLLSTVALRRKRAPDAPHGRDLFLLLYRTGGQRSSPWHVVYELVDEDGDGRADTLRVVRVRHAARE